MPRKKKRKSKKNHVGVDLSGRLVRLAIWLALVMSSSGIAYVINSVWNGDAADDEDRGRSPRQQGKTRDAECAKILNQPGTAEARAWLAAGDKIRDVAMFSREESVSFVDEAYRLGAKRVMVADPREMVGAETAMTYIVKLPDDAPRRQVLFRWYRKVWRNGRQILRRNWIRNSSFGKAIRDAKEISQMHVCAIQTSRTSTRFIESSQVRRHPRLLYVEATVTQRRKR